MIEQGELLQQIREIEREQELLEKIRRCHEHHKKLTRLQIDENTTILVKPKNANQRFARRYQRTWKKHARLRQYKDEREATRALEEYWEGITLLVYPEDALARLRGSEVESL